MIGSQSEIPLHCLSEVLRHTLTSAVHSPEVDLGCALFRNLAIPLQSLSVALPHALKRERVRHGRGLVGRPPRSLTDLLGSCRTDKGVDLFLHQQGLVSTKRI